MSIRSYLPGWCLIAALACALFAADTARAQLPQTQNDVEVELVQFGVRSVFRPGDMTGILLNVRINPAGNLGEAARVWVQWEVPDVDGDVVEYGRPVTLTRGRDTPVWLYAPLPPDAEPDTIWSVRVHEFVDGRRRAEVGGRRIRAADANASMVPMTSGMIGVIGRLQMGLNHYAVAFDPREGSPAAHELTRPVFGIRPDELPDRWEGLSGFEAIAWSDASPQQLTSDGAAALREYVRRGGHLIINLPEDANPWQFGAAQTPLADLLPGRDPRRDEGVPINDLVPLLTKSSGTPADYTMAIRVFRDLNGLFNVVEYPFEPLIATEDGRVVVIQRPFGHGRITITGIDLAQQRLYGTPLANGSIGLPQADAFWNRVLGRRNDTPLASELRKMAEADMLARSRGQTQSLGSGGLFNHQIGMTTQAGLGLLLAFVLFAAYWVVAGPGGFAVLKMYRKVEHAWIGFAAAAGIFTLLAWASVATIRINEPQLLHVTYLDHIARPEQVDRPEDPQYQRAISWFSLYTPGYGDTAVAIPSVDGQRNLISTWKPPGETIHRFPNVDRYMVDVSANPADYTIPSRHTATLMRADWMGGLTGEWTGMIRAAGDQPIRVHRDAGGLERELSGALVHELPGTLTNVTIIWVRNNRIERPRYQVIDGEEQPWVARTRSGQVLNTGHFWRQTAWEPGTRIDLSNQDFSAQSLLSRGIDDRYVREYRRRGFTARTTTTIDRIERVRFMEMLSIFHQLTPPAYLKARPDESDPESVTFNRHMAREVDLSGWFNRPCIIVIGFLENSELPYEMTVNGRRPQSEGVTVVRWVYPLPVDEEVAFGLRAAAEDELTPDEFTDDD